MEVSERITKSKNPEVTTKDRLGALLNIASGTEGPYGLVADRIAGFNYVYYAATKGGKAYPANTYLDMAQNSLAKGDREVAADFGCDAIVVQHSRINLIAVTNYLLQEAGCNTGIALHEFEAETQSRFAEALVRRAYPEAKQLASELESEHPALTFAIRTYAQVPSLMHVFTQLGIEMDDQEVQYHDRGIRELLKGSGTTRGFPKTFDRILFGWLLKTNHPYQTGKLMRDSAKLTRLELGSYHSHYFKQRKFEMFMRSIAAEDAYRWLYLQDNPARGYFTLNGEIESYTARGVNGILDTSAFLDLGADHHILPQSLRLLFGNIAAGNKPETGFLKAFPATSLSEGLRVLKGIMLSGEDQLQQLSFDYSQYHVGLEERIRKLLGKN